MTEERVTIADLANALKAFARGQRKGGRTVFDALDQLRISSEILNDEEVKLLKFYLNAFLHTGNKKSGVPDDLLQKCIRALDEAREQAEVRKGTRILSIPAKSPIRTGSSIQELGIIQKVEAPTFLYSLLAAVIVFSFLAVVKFTESYNNLSASPDSFFFLENGAYFAGFPQYQDYETSRPPVIPFLLSLMFRITGPMIVDGYLLSVSLYFLAMIACFLIAREIMNPWLSLLASISFGITPLVFYWGGQILSNVEGVAVASFAFATLILAVKRNKMLFLVAFPLLALAPQTRYTMASIIMPVIIYLLATRKHIALSKYIFWGILASIPVLIIFSYQWISYPISHHLGLSVLIPPPQPGDLGSALTFLFSLPAELGQGIYGYVLTALFVSGLSFALFLGLRRSFNKESSDVSPIVYALIAWFSFVFLYYSLDWPDKELRYSVEFVMPAIIIAFWSLSIVLKPLSSLSFGKSKILHQRLLPMVILVLVISSISYLAFVSGANVILNSSNPSSELTIGTSQAGYWLARNAPKNTVLASNVLPYVYGLYWFAPGDTENGVVDISSFSLKTIANYSSLNEELSLHHVGYLLIYPNLGFFVSPFNETLATFVPVWTSSQGNITIFRVN